MLGVGSRTTKSGLFGPYREPCNEAGGEIAAEVPNQPRTGARPLHPIFCYTDDDDGDEPPAPPGGGEDSASRSRPSSGGGGGAPAVSPASSPNGGGAAATGSTLPQPDVPDRGRDPVAPITEPEVPSGPRPSPGSSPSDPGNGSAPSHRSEPEPHAEPVVTPYQSPTPPTPSCAQKALTMALILAVIILLILLAVQHSYLRHGEL